MPSSEAEADADDESEEGLAGLNAAVKRGALPREEVRREEEAEDAAVLAVVVVEVEVEDKDGKLVGDAFFGPRRESRKDLA